MVLRILAILIIISLTFNCYAAQIKIGLLLDDLRISRWQTDRNYFVAKAMSLGTKVYVKSANGNVKKQIDQINNMIKRKVNVLVIIPTDSDSLSVPIAAAQAAGIKILAYDRLIKNADIDLYVSFNNVQVGEMQANAILSEKPKGNYFLLGGSPNDNNAHMFREGQMNVLQPAIDRGDIKIVGDEWATAWSSDVAQKHIAKFLRNSSKLDAIVASNDGTAGGAIMALTSKNLAGKVIVSGQDAELGALRRIVKNLQIMTVYKPIKTLAEASAILAIKLANRENIETNSTINNGKKNVPAKLLTPVAVTNKNIRETVIADGYVSKKDIYK